MKRLLILVTMAAGIAACNSNAKTNSQAYQTTQKYKDSIKLDSFKRAEAISLEIDRREQESDLTNNNDAASSVQRSRTQHVVHHTSAATPVAPAKKGWSSAAKGAVIGAGAGAVTGILVDKKDVRGAVIGGVVGAGTGYVIGRAKDKKTGRAQ